MLSFTGGLKVFIALEPCDLRKSFNELHAPVTECLGEDPRQGAIFAFTNPRRTRLKILCWNGTGLWVLIKRLEEGSFAWPKSVEPGAVKLQMVRFGSMGMGLTLCYEGERCSCPVAG